VNRQPAPPHVLAAAEQDYQSTQKSLARLMPTVRELLTECPTEIEAVAELWLILLRHDRRTTAMLGATAIVQLIKHQQPGRRMTSEPGN
jgi:hypothetical protein